MVHIQEPFLPSKSLQENQCLHQKPIEIGLGQQIATATYRRHQIRKMSSKPFVLFFNPVQHAMPFFQKLQEVAHTEVVTSKSRKEFFKDITDKYKNIFAVYRTSASGTVSIQLSLNSLCLSLVETLVEGYHGQR